MRRVDFKPAQERFFPINAVERPGIGDIDSVRLVPHPVKLFLDHGTVEVSQNGFPGKLGREDGRGILQGDALAELDRFRRLDEFGIWEIIFTATSPL